MIDRRRGGGWQLEFRKVGLPACGMPNVAYNEYISSDAKKYKITVGEDRRYADAGDVRFDSRARKIRNTIDGRNDGERYFQRRARIFFGDIKKNILYFE